MTRASVRRLNSKTVPSPKMAGSKKSSMEGWWGSFEKAGTAVAAITATSRVRQAQYQRGLRVAGGFGADSADRGRLLGVNIIDACGINRRTPFYQELPRASARGAAGQSPLRPALAMTTASPALATMTATTAPMAAARTSTPRARGR